MKRNKFLVLSAVAAAAQSANSKALDDCEFDSDKPDSSIIVCVHEEDFDLKEQVSKDLMKIFSDDTFVVGGEESLLVKQLFEDDTNEMSGFAKVSWTKKF
jgi:hypothetical protein